jgi:glycosyltransferase involved in cell wall biosynthesis
MHLAWFSPMPPVRSGVATYSAEVVAALDGEHEIDCFVHLTSPGNPRLLSAHDFVWRHLQNPYDLTVFQLGNSSHHDYMWPYLFRYPGLVVLHDVHLHHARAAALLRERRADDYRAEFAANDPDVDSDAAELAIAGFDSPLFYDWPFTRLVISSSRSSAVHSRVMRNKLAAGFPDAAVEHIRLGHGTPVTAEDAAVRRRQARDAYGIDDRDVVFGCFGGLTPDKRIPQILDAFEAILPYAPTARLILGGASASHYDPVADVQRRAISPRVVTTGYLEDDEDLTDLIAATDVTLNLRWPTAREISGPWLRCLAAGKPTVIIDLEQTADVPTLDPRTWTSSAADGAPPVAVALDILDEEHSLRLSMRRLAADSALRDSLGAAARQYWQMEHAHAAMTGDYRRAIARAASLPVPDVALPGHLRDAGDRTLARVLETFGVAVPWSTL